MMKLAANYGVHAAAFMFRTPILLDSNDSALRKVSSLD